MTLTINEREVAVNFSALEQDDSRDLVALLRNAIPNTAVRFPAVKTRDSVFAGPIPPMAIALFILPGVLYAGKKVIDVLADVAEGWLKSKLKCEHRRVELRGPDGAIVRIVECDLKPHEKK